MGDENDYFLAACCTSVLPSSIKMKVCMLLCYIIKLCERIKPKAGTGKARLQWTYVKKEMINHGVHRVFLTEVLEFTALRQCLPAAIYFYMLYNFVIKKTYDINLIQLPTTKQEWRIAQQISKLNFITDYYMLNATQINLYAFI